MITPFLPANASEFDRWSDWKRARALGAAEEAVVELADGANPSPSELRELQRLCGRSNFVVYRSAKPMDENGLLSLGRAVGLVRLDRNLCADSSGVSALRVVEGGVQGEYIPYTNRSLNWHTDGYYNEPSDPIRGFILHCVSPAAEGGENQLADPEMLYLHLRNSHPGAVEQLARPGAMTVPANLDGDTEIRPATTGSVFWPDASSGDLLVRYTARKRHIEWLTDDEFVSALGRFESAISDQSIPIYRYRLDRNEGLICNNVLHTRQPFQDSPEHESRCMLRARYRDRVAATGIRETFLNR